MRLLNILFGAFLITFSSLSSAALCTGVTGFASVNGNGFINPDPASTCRLDGENPGSQNAGVIGGLVEDAFELTDGSLSFLQAGESSGKDQAVGSNTISFGNLTAFNYLAVHYGRGELFFKFTNPITAFTLTGLPRGFSNYRTYTDNVSAVPLPAAGWLFGSALIGLMGLRRRKM